MESGLKGRTILITGASRNIGRITALMLAREGANLALCTSSKMDKLTEVADEARTLGARVMIEQCDVSDAAAVARFVANAKGHFGSVDVAINNAVYRAEGGGFLEQPWEKWALNVEVNLHGPYHVCRNVIPLMMEKRWGRIINYSGIAPYMGAGVAKSMAKLGIVGFTRGLAAEFAEYGITANCIGPGRIDVERDSLQDSNKQLRAAQPIRRFGTPEEISSLAVYLASERSSFITGQCYLANGGSYFL